MKVVVTRKVGRLLSDDDYVVFVFVFVFVFLGCGEHFFLNVSFYVLVFHFLYRACATFMLAT